MALNNEAYTAYPHEGEILLAEGCTVWILAIEDNVKIQNDTDSMSKYNGKSITIIHMIHPDEYVSMIKKSILGMF